jgi:hypothetical protein
MPVEQPRQFGLGQPQHLSRLDLGKIFALQALLDGGGKLGLQQQLFGMFEAEIGIHVAGTRRYGGIVT